MDKSMIIKKLVDYYANGNQTKFAQILGVVPMTISSWIKRNTFDIDLVYAKCLDISPEWLLTGEGSMLRNGGETGQKVIVAGNNSANANSNCTINSTGGNATIEELREQIRLKDEQLRAKDEQIAKMIGVIERLSER